MAITIDLITLHAKNGATDLGHIIDAVRNDDRIAAQAKAALDQAWIAKHGEVMDRDRTINDNIALLAVKTTELDEIRGVRRG